MDNFLMIRKGVLVANGRIITAGQFLVRTMCWNPRSPRFLQAIRFQDLLAFVPRLGRGSDTIRRTSYAEEETNASIIKKVVAYSKAYNALMLYGIKSDVYKWYDERPQFYLNKLKTINGADGAFLINPILKMRKRMRAVLLIKVATVRSKQESSKTFLRGDCDSGAFDA